MKQLAVFTLAAALLLTLCACGAEAQTTPSQPEKTRTVTDALGREVVLPETVEAIVPLGNTPRMAAYLGLADRVVGISGMDADEVTPLTAYAYVNREAWDGLPSAGTDAMGSTDYYPEVILSTGADVVLCSYPEDIVEDIAEKTGLPVVAVGQGTLFEEDYDQALRILGEACGVEERAEEVIRYLHQCLEDLDRRTADVPEAERPTVLSAAATFRGVHGIEGVRLSDPVLQAVNARNIAEDAAVAQAESAEVDREQILAWDPDYIFCDYGGVELVRQDAAEHPDYYAQLTAWEAGNVYQYPSSTSYYANLELSLANCYFVGSVLYPERFAGLDVREKANEICAFFLGEEDYLSVLEEYGAGYGPVTEEAA